MPRSAVRLAVGFLVCAVLSTVLGIGAVVEGQPFLWMLSATIAAPGILFLALTVRDVMLARRDRPDDVP